MVFHYIVIVKRHTTKCDTSSMQECLGKTVNEAGINKYVFLSHLPKNVRSCL